MNRRWRGGGGVLGGLTLGVAALVAAFWPKQALWQIPIDGSELLGIDEAQGRVCAGTQGAQGGELRCYALESGDLQSSDRLNIPRMHAVGPSTEPSPEPWPLRLSPDCQVLVA